MNALTAVTDSSRWRRPKYVLVTAPLCLLVAYPLLSDSLYYQNMIILSMILAIGAVGLNVITGFAGYVSLGQGAFLGLGAYTVGILTHDLGGAVWLWVPVAGLVSAVMAALLGVVAMRARGGAFVILTIMFLSLLQLIATNWRDFTGGTSGITLPIPTWSIDYQLWPFYYVLLGLLLVSVLMTWSIRRTKFGMGLIAIREDEDKAATIGINTPVYKIVAFAASALFVGMAGGVYGYYISFIDPLGMFNMLMSLQIVLALLLGGRATIWGPVLGAFLVEGLNEFANNDLGGGNTRLLVFGGLLIVVVLLLPNGILTSVGEWVARRRSRERAGVVGARLDGRIELREPVPLDSAPAVRGARPLLEVKAITKSFGGLRALDDCSFSVADGSITALIGPNGSGKTTAFNVIDGMMRADGGQVWFDGQRVDDQSPWRRAHAGIGRTYQITRLFRGMTVLENVVAPLRSFRFGQLAAGAVSGAEAERAEGLLEYVGMGRYRDQPCSALSYGQQKLVELAQVLMLDPKLIMLDEPAGGINPTLIERMGDMIRELNAQGRTFLIVEHNMPFVLGLCDPVLVLAQGATIAHGTPDSIKRDPAVLDAYLGDDFQIEPPVKV